MSKRDAIEAIKKKLLGKQLNYQEIFSLMDEIAHERLGSVLTTYFTAASFEKGFTNNELYYLTRAMVETGERLHFSGIVADKHSTGGVAGTRVTMILVPIIAAAGIKIPKNSSRAITSSSGTADTMEVLAPVTFSPKHIEKIVEKVGGCIVWGGHLGLAPADDIIIRVEKPLSFESFDKIVISIMAKKVASGANHVVFDIPVGKSIKITHIKDAELIANKFTYLAKKFKMKVTIDINKTLQPAGRGIGPTLEVLDVLRILEQTPDRPIELEQKALRLAGKLLDICYASMKKRPNGSGKDVARDILVSGKALSKMREIIKAQGGNNHVSSDNIKLATYKKEWIAHKKGRIVVLNNNNVNMIARILGSPADKKAGIYLVKRLEEPVFKGDILCLLYSQDKWRLKEAVETLRTIPIYTVE